MSKLTYPICHTESGIALVSLPKSIYSAEALRQTAYKFSGKCFVVFTEDGDNYNVTFESKNNAQISDTAVKEICNDFIDQQIRIDTEEQFGHIRDLIVEEAFKPINKSK